MRRSSRDPEETLDLNANTFRQHLMAACRAPGDERAIAGVKRGYWIDQENAANLRIPDQIFLQCAMLSDTGKHR